jgi:hypothetical protein
MSYTTPRIKTMSKVFDFNSIALTKALKQAAIEHAQSSKSTPTFQLETCGMKLVDHIAKLKVLYRSACFTDDVSDEEMLTSDPGHFGDSILIEHLIEEAIALHTEIVKIKSSLE